MQPPGPITNAGLGGNVYITGIVNSSTVQVGGPDFNGWLVPPGPINEAVQIGEPSITAPRDGEQVAQVERETQLDPAHWPGAPACSSNLTTETTLFGTWRNPATYDFGGHQPDGTVMLGEIDFAPVNTTPAYIIKRPPSTVGDPIGAAHYDIVFPAGLLTDTGADCPVTAGSPAWTMSLGINPRTPNQADIANYNSFVTFVQTVIGKPGSAQLRGIRDNGQAGSTTTAFLTSENPSGLYTGANFNRLCVVPSGPPTAGFKCGTG
jgi:hypothetical protein